MVGKKYFRKGDYVFREGDPGDLLYFIQEGRVLISRTVDGHELELASFPKGAVFGEFSMLDRKMRSADARAEENLELLAISREQFDKTCTAIPGWFQSILTILARRIRDSNVRLRYSSDKLTTASIANLIVLQINRDNKRFLHSHLLREDCVNLLGIGYQKVQHSLAILTHREIVKLNAGKLEVPSTELLEGFATYLRQTVRHGPKDRPSPELLLILENFLPACDEVRLQSEKELVVPQITLRSELRSRSNVNLGDIDIVFRSLEKDGILTPTFLESNEHKRPHYKISRVRLKNLNKVTIMMDRFTQGDQA